MPARWDMQGAGSARLVPKEVLFSLSPLAVCSCTVTVTLLGCWGGLAQLSSAALEKKCPMDLGKLCYPKSKGTKINSISTNTEYTEAEMACFSFFLSFFLSFN